MAINSVPAVGKAEFLVAKVLVRRLQEVGNKDSKKVYKSGILRDLKKTTVTWMTVSKLFKRWENANMIRGIKEGRIIYYLSDLNFQILKDMEKAVDKYVYCVSGIRPEN